MISFPPIHRRLAVCLGFAALLCTNPAILQAAVFSQGNPSDEEQYFLELVNRARANPTAEATSHGVTLNQSLAVGTISSAAKQPLAFHPSLLKAARGHSQWMIDTNIFSHTGNFGSSSFQRIIWEGYPEGASSAENIAWTWIPESPSQTVMINTLHKNLFVSASHRVSMLNPEYDEVGISPTVGDFRSGTTNYTNATVVTQDYARSASTPGPLVTGVVYYDYNNNATYDIGEGVGGALISAAGVSATTVSSVSGGYALPTQGNGTYAVNFSLTEAAPIAMAGVISNGNNTKLDVRMAYSPPVIGGSNSATSGSSVSFPYSATAGATSYLLRVSKTVDFIPVDGAEQGLLNIKQTTSGYYPIQTSIKKSGTAAFRLVQPKPSSQYLEINRIIIPSASGVLYFDSRLGYATSTQIAAVQVSTDSGYSWKTLWYQKGRGATIESSFRLRAVSLAAFSGQEIRVRMAYIWKYGTYYKQTTNGFGWYIDNIRFQGCAELADSSERSISIDDDIEIIFPGTGTYSMSLAARLPGRLLPFGLPKQVSVTAAP